MPGKPSPDLSIAGMFTELSLICCLERLREEQAGQSSIEESSFPIEESSFPAEESSFMHRQLTNHMVPNWQCKGYVFIPAHLNSWPEHPCRVSFQHSRILISIQES